MNEERVNDGGEENSGGPAEGEQNTDKGKGLLETLCETIRKHGALALGIPAVIAGLLTFWTGFGQWWFSWPGAWPWFVGSGVALVFVWLILFCRYLSDRLDENIELMSWNTLLTIGLPFLLLGIILACFIWNMRDTKKVLILVEPFASVESGEDPYGIASTIKSRLDRAISLCDRRHVKVVLGKKTSDASREESTFYERAVKYRADMIISGWFAETNKKKLVCVNFHVTRVPQSIEGVFRGRESRYPETLVFSGEDFENLNIHDEIAGKLEYECQLMLGAGAYAAGNWKMAERYFLKAVDSIKERRRTKGASLSKEQDTQLGVDKVMLRVYCGNARLNRGLFHEAIDDYKAVIDECAKLSECDTEYRRVRAKALAGRAVAYRQLNLFDVAGQDLSEAGKDELTYPVSFKGMESRALKLYNRGEDYLGDDKLLHAQADFDMAATSLRILLKEAELTELKQRYNFQLARSLVRLGEVHNRRAKPELRHDEHTERAIKYLNEARNIIEALEARGVADLDGLSSLHPDCLRHLGDAYRAMDQEDEVKNAIKYHAKAKRLWVDIGNKNEAGGELTRIGEVHRRLCDLNPKEHSVQLDKAIGAFKGAVEIRGGGKYLKALIDIESPGGQANLSKERKWLIEGSMEGINAHHLASSLTCLAEVKMHKDSSKLDLEYAAILLDCASECYCLTQEKLDEKVCSFVNKIIKKERNLTLKDDLGWCLTLHGYALIRQGMEPFEAPEDPDTYYKDVCEILDKAGTCYKAPDVDDEGHLVLNLFALSLAQFKLYEEEEAQTTLLEACRLLRRVIRKQKKVWYNDYIRDIIDELQDNKFLKEEGSHLGDVRKWLDSEHVRNGRRGLDEIIRIMDEKLNK